MLPQPRVGYEHIDTFSVLGSFLAFTNLGFDFMLTVLSRTLTLLVKDLRLITYHQ